MSLTEVEPLLNPLTPATYRVVAKHVETGDVVTLSLEPESASEPILVPAGPVQHADVLRGRGGRDLDQ